MKGQLSFEFLAAFFIFILAIIAVLEFVTADLPDFQDDLNQRAIHQEAEYVTDHVLSKEGYHSYGSGGSNWQKNESTRDSTEVFGLVSSYHSVDEDKLGNISTIGDSKFNYSQFKSVMKADHQYKFNFTWVPIVETHRTFRRGEPPSSPSITEPTSSQYDEADPEVHYGSISINNSEHHFLVTSHLGEYNTTYYSEDWDFSNSDPVGRGDRISIESGTYRVESFQNRDFSKGNVLVLSRHLKEFGATVDQNQDTVKLNRYAVFKPEGSSAQPLRVEVLVW